MPDPAGGVYAVVFLRGAVKIGRRTFEGDEPIGTVAELIAFAEEQVCVSFVDCCDPRSN